MKPRLAAGMIKRSAVTARGTRGASRACTLTRRSTRLRQRRSARRSVTHQPASPGQVEAAVPAALLVVACVALIVVIALVDYVTGVDLRIFPLYFLVIAIAAWKVSRNVAFAMALLSSLAWAIANTMVDQRVLPASVWILNIITQLSAFLLVALLIATVRKQLAREEELSRTDPLTRLLNPRGFRERAELLLAIARRNGCAITFAYIDLDNFKTVNDHHGHLAGDAALRVAADVLRSTVRKSDVIGRLGGDEFGALLFDTPDAEHALERLRDRLAEMMSERSWPITASVGAITFGSAPDSLDQALRAADEVMYSVKQAGKNRVRVEIARLAPAAEAVAS